MVKIRVWGVCAIAVCAGWAQVCGADGTGTTFNDPSFTAPGTGTASYYGPATQANFSSCAPGLGSIAQPMADALGGGASGADGTVGSCKNYCGSAPAASTPKSDGSYWSSVMENPASGPVGQTGPQGPGCKGSDTPPDATSLSCTDFESDGVFNSGRLLSKECSICTVQATITCKQNSIGDVMKDVQCLQSENKLLTSEIGQIQAMYDQNVSKQQQDMSTLNALVDDRTNQMAFANERLNGGKDTGAAGINQLITATEAMRNQMKSDILATQQAQQQDVNNVTVYQGMVDAYTMQMAADCFKNKPLPNICTDSPNSVCSCVPGGPPQTAADYISCSYNNRLKLSSNGQYQQNANNDANAGAGATGLANLLAEMENDMPQASQLNALAGASSNPNNGGPNPATMNFGLNNMTAVENQFGHSLSSYDLSGMPIHDFTMDVLGRCYATAQTTMQKNLAQPAYFLSSMKQTFTNQAQAHATQAKGLIDGYALQYSRDMEGMTGVAMPIDTSYCKNASPATQLACMNDMDQNLNSVLTGTGSNGLVNVNVPAATAGATLQFQCQGLEGCKTAYENLYRNLQDTEIPKLKKFKTDYATAAQQSFKTYTTQMAQMFSVATSGLNDTINKINGKLAVLGNAASLDISPVKPEEMELDDNGLPKSPKNALALVSGKMNPPMPNLNPSSMSDILQGVSSAQSDLSQKAGTAQASMDALTGLQGSCAKESAKKLASGISADLTNLDGCAVLGSPFVCNGLTPQNDITSLFNTLSAVPGVSVAGISCNQPATTGQDGSSAVATSNQLALNNLNCNGVVTRLVQDKANLPAVEQLAPTVDQGGP